MPKPKQPARRVLPSVSVVIEIATEETGISVDTHVLVGDGRSGLEAEIGAALREPTVAVAQALATALGGLVEGLDGDRRGAATITVAAAPPGRG